MSTPLFLLLLLALAVYFGCVYAVFARLVRDARGKCDSAAGRKLRCMLAGASLHQH